MKNAWSGLHNDTNQVKCLYGQQTIIGRNIGIDILRILMAFFVVCQHITDYPWNEIIMPQSRIAVPVFFIVSGYFLYDKDNDKVNQRIIKSFKHIFWIFLSATALYAMYGIFENYPDGNFDFLKVGPWKLFVFVVSCSPLNFPYGFHLWFLIGLLEGLAILFIMRKLNMLNGGGQNTPRAIARFCIWRCRSSDVP